jgi:hypothetical protein
MSSPRLPPRHRSPGHVRKDRRSSRHSSCPTKGPGVPIAPIPFTRHSNSSRWALWGRQSCLRTRFPASPACRRAGHHAAQTRLPGTDSRPALSLQAILAIRRPYRLGLSTTLHFALVTRPRNAPSPSRRPSIPGPAPRPPLTTIQSPRGLPPVRPICNSVTEFRRLLTIPRPSRTGGIA